ncbi:Crp/Fnr family transcriptional regulator [Puniceibacterium confluentis]|uniref:Crp/Fnr family transcriptional regulator n=1 Tax=Puniceibacterium confluentis TaxID=1958944 RepID=UPI0011B62369|nr:Crp/Fnr family transcriptional regulator [Puniceibacterium confluentis]
MTRILEFPDLPGVTVGLRQDLAKRSTQRHVSQESPVFAPGAPVDAMLILLLGTLRVEHVAQAGGETVLYRVHGGESCIPTAACTLADAACAATWIAETDLDLMSLPIAAFNDLMARSQEFRGLIFQTYAMRISDLMQVVEELACRRTDIRLAGRLTDLAGSEVRIVATQQQSATEMDTSRDVASRQLGEFQRRGCGQVGRGHVRLRDKKALGELAHSDRATLV